jgi:hypothetical protein
MSISLSSIATGQRLKAPKITLYGVGGIGKTTFAASAPNPIYIFTEEGQGRLDVPRFEPQPDKPVVQSWEQIMDCVYALHEQEHSYQTVVLDTLDFAEPMLWRYTAAKHNQDNIESFGYGKGYLHACDEARMLLQWLDALRNDKGMAVVLLAHSDTKKYDAPDHEPYDRYKLRLHDRLANLVHDWSDAMLFANWRVHVVKDVQGSGKSKKETARGVGTGERVMFTEERPAWWAKNRYGLPFEMPLSWQALQEGIAAGATPPATTKPKQEDQSNA